MAMTVTGMEVRAVTDASPGFANDEARMAWQARERAREAGDWATVAELATRRHRAHPDEVAVLGELAEARLREGKRDVAKQWLDRWEEAQGEPSASMWALRGEWWQAEHNQEEARKAWEQSYELEPSLQVARFLTEESLWTDPPERLAYEALMKRIAQDHGLLKARRIAAESAARGRDWEAYGKLVRLLNDEATRSAMREAAALERMVSEKNLARLQRLDAEIASESSGLALAKRSLFFTDFGLNALGVEDGEAAAQKNPKMMLPRVAWARALWGRRDVASVRELSVVVKPESVDLLPAGLPELERLDAQVAAAADGEIPKKALLERAQLLVTIGQPYLAELDLEALGDHVNATADGLACRGDCLMARRKRQEARDAYRRALELKDDHEGAWEGLGQIAMVTADYREAAERYGYLLQRNPENEAYQQSLSLARSRIR